MSNNRYSEILEKYYNGGTTVEEERWLKEQAHLAGELLPLTEMKEQPQMNWSFEEMLQQAEQQSRIPAAAKISSLRWIKYAAAVLIPALLCIAIFIKKEPKHTAETAVVKPFTAPVIKELIKDTLSHETNNPVAPAAIAVTSPVKTKKKKAAPVKAPLPTQQNDDFFVLVDGRRITDENEALAILQQSFSKISGDMKTTMADINNSPKLDFKFK